MIIKYDLIVKTEYHIGTGLERPGIVDRTLVTRTDGTLVIPAEHFRGIVRDACTQILYWIGKESECCESSLKKAPIQSRRGAVPETCGVNFGSRDNPCVLCRLFGTTFIPKRYHFFDNVAKGQKCKRVSVHNRVEPSIGRVPEETFFSFEVGAPVNFTGQIKRDKSKVEQKQLDEEIGLLLAGLRLVERVGARSRRGWGECRVKITDIIPDQNKTVDELIGNYLNVDLKGGEK